MNVKLYCPKCDKRFDMEEYYPLPDGVDIAQCKECNTILEMNDKMSIKEEIFGKIEKCWHCKKEIRIAPNSTLDTIKRQNNKKPLCFRCFSYHGG